MATIKMASDCLANQSFSFSDLGLWAQASGGKRRYAGLFSEKGAVGITSQDPTRNNEISDGEERQGKIRNLHEVDLLL